MTDDETKPWPLVTSTLDRAPNPIADAPPMCAGKITSGFHLHPCSRRGYAEHEGQWFCKMHHPPTLQAKDDERRRKDNAVRAAEENRKARAKAYVSELRVGQAHFHTPPGGGSKGQGYTGGIALTEDETRCLLKFLQAEESTWRAFLASWEAGHVGTDR